MIDVTGEGFVLREIAPGLTVAEVQVATGARLLVPAEPAVIRTLLSGAGA